jgi:hypothetical protein
LLKLHIPGLQGSLQLFFIFKKGPDDKLYDNQEPQKAADAVYNVLIAAIEFF